MSTIDLKSGRVTRPTCGELQGGTGGPWYVRVARDEVWVAVTATSGGGGGWFRADDSLDPASSDWDEIDPSDVLAAVSTAHDKVVQLSAEMLISCLNDRIDHQALHLADVMIDEGFDIRVSVVPRSDERGAAWLAS
jgi:hypothetical protein